MLFSTTTTRPLCKGGGPLRVVALVRRCLATTTTTSPESAVLEAIRKLSLVPDSAPPALGPIEWTPSPEQLRRELSTPPRGDVLPNLADHADPFALVKEETAHLSQGMRDLVKTDHPLLSAAASHFFAMGGSGKKFRGAMILLLARAIGDEDAKESQSRLAEVVELIHTASLFHDDVIDGASTRRGVASANAKFGDKVAILAGDFLLARACVALARLRHLDVVEILATVIEHLVRGEIVQMRPGLNVATDGVEDHRLVSYLSKNFYKTGSLMANSCRATAMLSTAASPEVADAAFRYGRHVGLAFQLVDDALDFRENALTLGKPALNDLRQGLATAPTLLAARRHPDALEPLIARRFQLPGDVDLALRLVQQSDALNETLDIATAQAEMAVVAIRDRLEPSESRDALEHLAVKVVQRSH